MSSRTPSPKCPVRMCPLLFSSGTSSRHADHPCADTNCPISRQPSHNASMTNPSKRSPSVSPKSGRRECHGESPGHSSRRSLSPSHSSRMSPRASPRPSPGQSSRMSPGHKAKSPGHSPEHNIKMSPGHSPGHNPRMSPRTNPRLSPGQSPRMSPGHKAKSPGHSPERNPSMSPGHSPRMSQEHSPGHNPSMSAGHSPGHNPRTSPGHSSRMSPGHNPRLSPDPSAGPGVRRSSVSPSRSVRRSSSRSPRRGPPPLKYFSMSGVSKIDFYMFVYDLALCALQNCEPRWRPEKYWSYQAYQVCTYYQPIIGWIANHEDSKTLMRVTLQAMDFNAEKFCENPSLLQEFLWKMYESQNKELFPELLLSFFCEMMPMAALASRKQICEEFVSFLSDTTKHSFWHREGFLDFLSKIRKNQNTLCRDGRENFIPLSKDDIEGKK